MYSIVFFALALSIILNIRLAYCLGKHYKWKDKVQKVAQGGRKILEENIELLHKECVCEEEKKCCDNIKDD